MLYKYNVNAAWVCNIERVKSREREKEIERKKARVSLRDRTISSVHFSVCVAVIVLSYIYMMPKKKSQSRTSRGLIFTNFGGPRVFQKFSKIFGMLLMYIYQKIKHFSPNIEKILITRKNCKESFLFSFEK